MSDRQSGRRSQAFNPKLVLALLLFGALTFFALLYFIGSGQTGGETNDGKAHAASKGLHGYAALVDLLKANGHDVRMSRNPTAMDDEGLLVLTPPSYASAEEIATVIEKRRWEGPTLIILPKWIAVSVPPQLSLSNDVEEGWVMLVDTQEPGWAEDLDEESNSLISAEEAPGPVNIDLQTGKSLTGWSGLGLSGKLPKPEDVQSIKSGNVQPLVVGEKGAILAAYVDDGGWYSSLDIAAGFTETQSDEKEGGWWNVTIVAEPDLMNNYGMADSDRAQLAVQIIEASMEDSDIPIIFDVTFNGLGQSKNLLTLAFTPPFLAATICLIIAMIVIAWRAFLRFGPAITEGRRIAFGKERLVRNSAGFIQRTGRLHLLSKPYADMMRSRITSALGLRNPDDETMDAAIARRLPDEQPVSDQIATLKQARSQPEVLRTADALHSIERELSR